MINLPMSATVHNKVIPQFPCKGRNGYDQPDENTEAYNGGKSLVEGQAPTSTRMRCSIRSRPDNMFYLWADSHPEVLWLDNAHTETWEYEGFRCLTSHSAVVYLGAHRLRAIFDPAHVVLKLKFNSIDANGIVFLISRRNVVSFREVRFECTVNSCSTSS